MSKKDMDRRKKFILELMGDPIYQPMRLREISSLLRLSKEEKRELYDVLEELCEEGKVSVDRKGRYEKVKGKWKKKKDDRYYDDRREEYGSEYGRKKKDKNKKDKNKKEQPEGIQAEGTFIGHPKGFGFVEIEGQDEDIFIPESDTGTAMHQDKVRIIIRNDKKQDEHETQAREHETRPVGGSGFVSREWPCNGTELHQYQGRGRAVAQGRDPDRYLPAHRVRLHAEVRY